MRRENDLCWTKSPLSPPDKFLAYSKGLFVCEWFSIVFFLSCKIWNGSLHLSGGLTMFVRKILSGRFNEILIGCVTFNEQSSEDVIHAEDDFVLANFSACTFLLRDKLKCSFLDPDHSFESIFQWRYRFAVRCPDAQKRVKQTYGED